MKINPCAPVCNVKRYKIVTIGDAMTGKTKWTNSLLGANNQIPYVPTLGVDVHPVSVANHSIILNIWDTAGEERFTGPIEAYYIESDVAIVFGQNTDSWVSKFKGVCPNARVIFAGNSSNSEITQKLLVNLQV
jgi:GTP-binding nuclear protein Ran